MFRFPDKKKRIDIFDKRQVLNEHFYMIGESKFIVIDVCRESEWENDTYVKYFFGSILLKMR